MSALPRAAPGKAPRSGSHEATGLVSRNRQDRPVTTGGPGAGVAGRGRKDGPAFQAGRTEATQAS